MAKNLPVMQEKQESCVQSLGQEDPLEEEMATLGQADPLEEEMATHSSILA